MNTAKRSPGRNATRGRARSKSAARQPEKKSSGKRWSGRVLETSDALDLVSAPK